MKTSIGIGDMAPDFDLPTNSDGRARLKDYRGKNLILYFYPKDDTSGCTKQAISFTEHLPAFADLNTAILGLSKDSPASHDKFIAKHSLGITLASDETLETCQAYGVWVEKNMYGRKYMGVERSTFLIGEDGKIVQVWRKVRVPNHIENVLEAIRVSNG
jgi:peroxiredoxin Q/BCP